MWKVFKIRQLIKNSKFVLCNQCLNIYKSRFVFYINLRVSCWAVRTGIHWGQTERAKSAVPNNAVSWKAIQYSVSTK